MFTFLTLTRVERSHVVAIRMAPRRVRDLGAIGFIER
jgi:hypothetical protein